MLVFLIMALDVEPRKALPAERRERPTEED
jgi:hypothetical protein